MATKTKNGSTLLVQLALVVLGSALAGCSGHLRIPGLSLIGPGGSSEAAPSTEAKATQKRAAEPTPAETAAAEEKKAAEAAKKAEAAKQLEQEKALATKEQQLVVPELGVQISVPGDVKAEARTVSAYGSPDFMLKGAHSYFTVIITDATSDRYSLEQRITKQNSDFRHGVDVIRKEQQPSGAWEFEYSYPLYYNDGTSAGTEMGYFGRKVVAGKKYNCLVSGLSQAKLDQVVKACSTITAAKTVATK